MKKLLELFQKVSDQIDDVNDFLLEDDVWAIFPKWKHRPKLIIIQIKFKENVPERRSTELLGKIHGKSYVEFERKQIMPKEIINGAVLLIARVHRKKLRTSE